MADMVADMEVDMVADIELDMVADMEVDININIDMEIQLRVGHGGWLIGPKHAHLLRFASLFSCYQIVSNDDES